MRLSNVRTPILVFTGIHIQVIIIIINYRKIRSSAPNVFVGLCVLAASMTHMITCRIPYTIMMTALRGPRADGRRRAQAQGTTIGWEKVSDHAARLVPGVAREEGRAGGR